MNIDIQNKVLVLPETPKKIKKITGTRFASILGLNPWSSPFEVWCDMTGTYKIPFEDNQYTIAGKTIEPKVIEYLDKKYYYGRRMVKDPDEWFGKTKQQMNFDHFHENKTYGGMWDARTKTAVFELKTTKRVEDWYKGGVFDAPIYYKLQGALYAWLLGLDDFRLVLTILTDKDYEHPEEFVPTPENTVVKKYSLKAEFPQFESFIETCEKWLQEHINNPSSPVWDEAKKCDAEIIKALRTSYAIPESNEQEQDIISVLLREIEPLQAKIDLMAEDEKRLKTLKDQLKPELEKRMKDSDKKIIFDGCEYSFTVSRTSSSSVDTNKLKADGLYDKYKKTGTTVKLNVERKEVI